MMLKDELRNQGDFLFRWRSFLPLALLPLAILATSESAYLMQWVGETLEEGWEVFCLGVSLLGLLLRAATVGFAPDGTSGRNTKGGQRAETLNTTGPYSTVRNPLYLGNYLIFIGFVLAIKVWWFVLLASIAYALYYERIIMAEEAFLHRKFGEAYAKWAARTPAILPNPRLWRRPVTEFSPRRVLRREYNGFYLIATVFTLIEIADDLVIEGESIWVWLASDWPWLAFFAAGTLAFVSLRTLKRHTRLLRAPGP